MKRFSNLLTAALLMGGTIGWAQGLPDLEPTVYNTQAFTYDKNKKQLQPGSAKSSAFNGREKRPDHLNNALLKYFPPIFSQDHGSCEAANYIGYQWTYEHNCYHNLDAQYPENRFASHFNFLLTHSGQGSFQDDLVQKVGNASEADYGGQTYSKYFGSQDCKDRDYGWMQGYDKWYRTAFNRDWTYAFFEDRVTTEAGREAVKNWLWNHEGDYDYPAGGVVWVGVNINGSDIRQIPSTPTNRSIGVAGKKYMHQWGDTGGHAMTIVGYDDRIEFDLDGNGVYGEKDKDEVGAWLIANSWGNNWEDNGFVYCPYPCCTPKTNSNGWNVKRHFIRKDYEPLRMLKLKLAFSRRSALQLSVGVAQDTAATEAEETITMHHFNYAGDGQRKNTEPPLVPMLGKWIDGFHYEPMEFGYDLTDLTSTFDRRRPLKYFFTIRTRDKLTDEYLGTGRLYAASIIDYELDKEGMEFPFQFEKLDIGGTGSVYTISVVVPGEQVNPPLNLSSSDTETLCWEQPATTSLQLKQYYIYCDGHLADSVDADVLTYTPSATGDKAYSVAAVYDYEGRRIVSDRSNQITVATPPSTSDNLVLEMRHTLAAATDVGFPATRGGTLEYWIKPYSLAKYSQQLGNSAFIYSSCNDNGQIECGTAPDKTHTVYGSAYILTNQWTHVVVIRDHIYNSIYINGERRTASGDGYANGLQPFSELFLGRDERNGLINGQIDEVRLWSRILTQEEINNNRLSEIADPSAHPDLVLYFKGNTFEDSEGNLCIRDYARGHHAIIRDADSVRTIVDNNLLKGSSSMKINISDYTDDIYAGTPVQFAATIPGCATAIHWTVDNEPLPSANSATPYITFTTPGTHTLKVSIDYAGNKTLSSPIKRVSVNSVPTPVADFEIARNNLPASEPFSFINRSSAVNATYKWSLPGADMEEIYATNASARFLEVGSYPVTLTVTNAAGTSSITKEVTAVASAPAPDFNIGPSAILLGDKVFFEDKTIYNPDEWQWEINHVSGKRNYAIRAQNTAFTPEAPGYYDVTLKTRNAQGQTSKTQRKAFAVSNADPGNGLAFYGEGEQISIPSPFTSNTRNFTIDAWLKPAAYNGILTGTTDDGKVKTYSNDDGSLSVEIGGKTATSDPGFFILDEWHHYAVTFATGNVKFYRDAALFSTPTMRLGLSCPAWTGAFTLGSADTPFKGLIDELHIWSKAHSEKQILSYCNQPLGTDDIATATSTNGLLLYYNFNQNSGNIIDRTGNNLTGTRLNISGADGDAWTSALGVFTLDFEGDEPSDVSADYLTNYKAPFLDNGEAVSTSNSSNLRGLLTGTEDSKWVIEGSVTNGKSTTGAHVYKTLNSDLNFRTGYYGFADTLKNHRLYQTVTLPAGYYTLSVKPSEGGAWVADSSLLCVVRGDEFVDMLTYENKAEAYVPLSDGSIKFTVGEEEDITIGVIINLTGWNAIDINEFKLMRTPVTEVEPDDETSIYDAVASGSMPRYTPMANAIRVVNEEKRPMKVYTLDGRLVFNEDVEGVHIIPFAPGIYIIDGEKIQVKN